MAKKKKETGLNNVNEVVGTDIEFNENINEEVNVSENLDIQKDNINEVVSFDFNINENINEEVNTSQKSQKNKENKVVADKTDKKEDMKASMNGEKKPIRIVYPGVSA